MLSLLLSCSRRKQVKKPDASGFSLCHLLRVNKSEKSIGREIVAQIHYHSVSSSEGFFTAQSSDLTEQSLVAPVAPLALLPLIHFNELCRV